MNYCFGVDVGGTTVKMGLFKFDGELLEKWEIVTRKENQGASVLPDIAYSIAEKLKEHNITKKEVLGIGVGVPAPVSDDGVVNGSANIGWGYKEVKHELEDLTGVKVKVGNDANVAALGEMWKGGGQGYKNMVMITLGTGVGGGLIVGGRVITGANGAGGEVGHICVNKEETESCGCGRKGCLEQYASATGVVRVARKILADTTEETVLNPETVTAKDVFDAVKAGDKVAMQVAEVFGDYLGRALADISVLMDPSVIVIGGGVSRAGSVLIDYVQKPYMETALFANKNVKFELAQLGNDAGIYGAAKMIVK